MVRPRLIRKCRYAFHRHKPESRLSRLLSDAQECEPYPASRERVDRVSRRCVRATLPRSSAGPSLQDMLGYSLPASAAVIASGVQSPRVATRITPLAFERRECIERTT